MNYRHLLFPALLILSAFVLPTQAAGQEYEGCVDIRGVPVRTIVDRTLHDVAEAKLDPGGIPIITINPDVLARYSPQSRRFWYMHECGHHALGHNFGTAHRLAAEQLADCFAISSLVGGGTFSERDVGVLQAELAKLPGDWSHIPGPQRAINLRDCLGSNNLPTREVPLENETDSPEMKDCLAERPGLCMEDCRENYGYSYFQCKKALCLNSPTNVAAWRRVCAKAVAPAVEARKAVVLGRQLGGFSQVFSAILAASDNGFDDLLGSRTDGGGGEEPFTYASKINLEGAKRCEVTVSTGPRGNRNFACVFEYADISIVKARFASLRRQITSRLSKWEVDDGDPEFITFKSADKANPRVWLSMRGPNRQGSYVLSLEVIRFN